jgi:hypothetical protein
MKQKIKIIQFLFFILVRVINEIFFIIGIE